MKKLILTLFIFIGYAFVILLYGQEEKIDPRLSISYSQADNDAPVIVVSVKKKIDRRFFPMVGLPVKVFLNEETDEMQIGEVVTNAKGEGKIVLPKQLIANWEQLDTYDFIGSMKETDSTEEVNESITINRARIRVTTNDSEDGKSIKAVIEKKNGEAWEPVPDVEMKVFVKRGFGRLFFGDDSYTTDEEGNIEAEFTSNVPKDVNGNLEIGCMIEDNEEFGNLFAYSKTSWGTPFVDDNSAFNKRTLWSTRDKTPYWLLIFPNFIIAGVWGVVVYLLYQIFRIKKLSKVK